MTLDEEIKFWTDVHRKRADVIGFFAFGVASGLKMAKANYGAANETAVVPSIPLSQAASEDRQKYL